jgi:uncharacterized protein (TIGR02996 family)
MMHHTLIQDIIADPEDDAPRLAYADWLQEHGQPDRAQFIRIQCELARRSEYSPDRRALELQEDRLLAHHRDEWLAPLRNILEDDGLWPPCRFRRGFVETIRITATRLLENAHFIFNTHPVRKATLLRAGAELTGLAACDYLNRLSALRIAIGGKDDPYTIVDLKTFLGSAPLRGLRSFGLRAIGGGPLKALLRSELIEQLTCLDLSGTRLTDRGMEVLSRSPELRAISSLVVHNNPFKIRGVRALASCPYLASLTSLAIGFTYIGEECGEALAASPFLSRLTELYLSETNIGDVGLSALAASTNTELVTKLWLDANRITAIGVKALANSPHFEQLDELVLYSNNIRDDGAHSLARSESLTRLNYLCLGNSAITDDGARAIAESPALASLKRLDLWSTGSPLSNAIGDAGALALAASPYLAGLVCLKLQGNPIGSRGEQALRACFGDRVQVGK